MITPVGLSPASNLSDVASAATARINLGAAQSLARTAVKTSAYTAAAGDLVPVDTTSGAVTVTLPAAPADGSPVAVKHVIQGGTNAVTVACAGSDVFNKVSGSASLTLPLPNQGVLLAYNAAASIWTVLSDDLPLSGLDLRYSPLAGSSSIVTLGTVATGVWSATAIGVTRGGTGLTGVASGKLLYASATDTLAPLSLGTNLSITTGTLNAAGSTYTTFVASGASHAGGLVPDPGASAGTAKFLREDATWATLPGPTVGGAVASGTNNRVLYQNSSGNLAESANLAYDGSNLTANGILSVSDGQRIGADTSGRFSITAYAVASSGTPAAGELRWNSGTTMVRMDGTLALGSAVIIRWSSGDPTTVGCDVSLYRPSAGVVSVGGGSNPGPGGLASAANTPTTLAADANNYSPGVGLFQRWSASTPVNVTGMAAGQAGEVRYMVNANTNAITLPNQSASSTAANRWLTTTGSSLVWGANQMVFAIYDATTACWRVSLLP